MLRIDRALHLIDLLIVLVRPHVGGNRRGERVERDTFESIAEIGVAEHREELLERVHELDDRAELGTLKRVAAGEALVAAEHAVDLAVIAIEEVDHLGARRRDLPGRWSNRQLSAEAFGAIALLTTCLVHFHNRGGASAL